MRCFKWALQFACRRAWASRLATLFLLIAAAASTIGVSAQNGAISIWGKISDPTGHPLAGAHLRLDSTATAVLTGVTDGGGTFHIALPAWGSYVVRVEAPGFSTLTRKMNFSAETTGLELQFEQVATATEEVVVSADVNNVTLNSPDPSERILVREELLDANPGRPGAPVSIPGLPTETASGGIKAPQYFAPGVPGDHGEPIAQYIAVGGYLFANNLSANAHGNGYADPNIFVSGALGNVTTDGGAFNVLEGNHALNLAATYGLRPRLSRFFTLTGDSRDVDLTAGIAPQNPDKKEWLAVEANYGNGLMKRLEHRKQFKWNAQRIFDTGRHEVSIFSIGYWGESHEGNLVPLGQGLQLGDTIDPRQMDQTHTSIQAVDDLWNLRARDQVEFSGFFRTYNLGLYSNFGEGLIRQSEFRTVEGAEARETHQFAPWLQGMAGFDYHEDDIHRDNLDHYLSGDPMIYGPFLKVLSSNVTIRDATPYLALHGSLGKHLRFYAGLRPDAVELKNIDTMNSANSFDLWRTLLSPKATLAWAPGAGPFHWLPSASFSMGQGFFTEDPRIAVSNSVERSAAGRVSVTFPF